MLNILISRTDPYSFMGLIKASRTKSTSCSSFAGLVNAGIISVFLIFAITRMAQAAQAEDHVTPTACSLEACNLV